jgi:hypothetical protein
LCKSVLLYWNNQLLNRQVQVSFKIRIRPINIKSFLHDIHIQYSISENHLHECNFLLYWSIYFFHYVCFLTTIASYFSNEILRNRVWVKSEEESSFLICVRPASELRQRQSCQQSSNQKTFFFVQIKKLCVKPVDALPGRKYTFFRKR